MFKYFHGRTIHFRKFAIEAILGTSLVNNPKVRQGTFTLNGDSSTGQLAEEEEHEEERITRLYRLSGSEASVNLLASNLFHVYVGAGQNTKGQLLLRGVAQYDMMFNLHCCSLELACDASHASPIII